MINEMENNKIKNISINYKRNILLYTQYILSNQILFIYNKN